MRLMIASLILTATLAAATNDLIVANDSRPVWTLTLELQKRYGFLISYEEAPFDQSSADVETLTSGKQYLIAKVVPVSFSLPDAKLSSLPGFVLSSVIGPLLKTYNISDNPRKMSALFYGGYAHIIPTVQLINGKATPFQPVLSTPVSLFVQDKSCSEALDSLLAAIQQPRGVTIAKGSTPVGSLLLHRCTFAANSLSARDILAQLLDQLNFGSPSDSPRSHFSWGLLYDLNTNKYFLNTTLLSASAAASVPANLATKTTTTPTSSSTATPVTRGRLSVPVAKPRQ